MTWWFKHSMLLAGLYAKVFVAILAQCLQPTIGLGLILIRDLPGQLVATVSYSKWLTRQARFRAPASVLYLLGNLTWREPLKEVHRWLSIRVVGWRLSVFRWFEIFFPYCNGFRIASQLIFCGDFRKAISFAAECPSERMGPVDA